MTDTIGMDTQLIAPYLTRLASTAPTPGGGSASAATGAIGAALLAMVAGISLRTTPEGDQQLRLMQVISEIQTAQEQFVELGAEDERAYRRFRDVLALPKTTPEEKKNRRQALQDATRLAAQPPLAVALLAATMLDLIPALAPLTNSSLRPDLGTAAHLLAGSGHGALVMVDTNIAGLQPGETRNQLTVSRQETGARLVTALAGSLQTI